MTKRIVGILLLCAFSIVAGTKPAASNSGPRKSDAEIEATIKIKLAKSKIGKDGFQVHVKNGIATWQGSTSVIQHKGAATRMARTSGAIQVVNNIKISDAAKEKAVENLNGGPRPVKVTAN